jgi:phage host-nuclease inhibitor protein Gam
MRSTLLVALIFSVLLGSTFWYQTTKHLCPVPIAYRIGELNPAFNLSEADAKAVLVRAEAVWEADFQRELLRYDDTADFLVNFVFDDRQATNNTVDRELATLDAVAAQNEAYVENIKQLQAEFADLQARYEADVDNYQAELTVYNEEVQRYNDQGGAPPNEFERLNTVQAELAATAASLDDTVRTLRRLQRELNRLGAETNERIRDYNAEVEEFNAEFGEPREFTQGDYQGDEINIYAFNNEVELVTVLAHEFGHAFGINHIDEQSSVMYYLTQERSEEPTLTDLDRTAFFTTCGATESWQQRVRRLIRERVLTLLP